MAADLPPRRIHYRALADTLDAWMRARLWAQVMAGLVLGVGIGLALSEDAGLVNPALSAALGEWLALFVVGASTLAATRGRRASPSLSCPA